MKNRKAIGIICILLLLVCCFGCGKPKTDSEGNALITSDWKLIEMTTAKNGTTVIEDEPAIIKILFSGKNPSFKTKDGIQCVFSNNGKNHAGTIIPQDDGFLISFSDGNQAGMRATITGDILTITGPKESFVLKFQAK